MGEDNTSKRAADLRSQRAALSVKMLVGSSTEPPQGLELYWHARVSWTGGRRLEGPPLCTGI